MAGLRLHTFKYTGDGTNGRIISCPFIPLFALVKRNGVSASAFRWNNLPAATCYRGNAGGAVTNRIVSLGASGMTIDNNAETNTIGEIYHGFMLGGDASAIYQGAYAGNNTSSNTITGVGFQYDLLFIQRAAVSVGQYTFGNYGVTRMDQGSMQGWITPQANGFTLTNNNAFVNAAATYYFCAVKMDTGFHSINSFMGDGTDNKNITSVGFQPQLTIIKNQSGGVGWESLFRTDKHTGDESSFFGSAFAPMSDAIQTFLSNGFQVGSDLRVNETGNNIRNMSLRDTAVTGFHHGFLTID